MGYVPSGGFQAQGPATLQSPTDTSQPPVQTQPGSTDTSQTTDPPSQAVDVAAVTISPPASIMSLGDVIDVQVSLTGLAMTDTILYPIVYQVLDDGSYSPIGPSVFLFPQIKVPAGSTTIDFQMQYQSLSSPGNYVVNIVTADEASQRADLTRLPVTTFASFIIQTPPTVATDSLVIAGTIGILEATGAVVAAGATVEAHLRADDTTVAITTTDAKGNFSLPVSTVGVPFDGYLTLTKSGLLPVRLYVSRPLTSGIQIGNVFLIPSAALGLLYQLVNVQPRGNQATAVISVRDSTLSVVHAAGISINAPAAVVTYTDADTSGLPSLLGTSGGNIWALNVPPGPTEIYARSNGMSLGTAQIRAIPDQMTFVLFIVESEDDTFPSEPPPTSEPGPTSEPVDVASVTISPPASIMSLGDVIDVQVSLTGLAMTDTILYPIVYQVLDNSYSPIDPSVFLFPQIEVPAGSATTDFQMQYQNLSSLGNYVLSVVTADEASQVADSTQLPVTHYASFIVQPSPSPWRQDITVGWDPMALTFDGTSIWVIYEGSNTVSKLLASDGSGQGTFVVTGMPWAAVSTSNILWIACAYPNGIGGNLTALSPYGPILKMLPLLQQPIALASLPPSPAYGPEPPLYFVTYDHLDLFQVDLTTGQVTPVGIIGDFSGGLSALLFDGTNLWISSSSFGGVVKVDLGNRSQIHYQGAQGGAGLAFDGNNIWVANYSDNTVTKRSVNDGQILQIIPTGTYPYGMAFDGTNVWVANFRSNTLTKIRASDGALLDTLATGLNPTSVVFDGAHIWVANYGSNTVSKF